MHDFGTPICRIGVGGVGYGGVGLTGGLGNIGGVGNLGNIGIGNIAGGAAGNIGVGLGVGVPQQIRYQEINSVPLGILQPYGKDWGSFTDVIITFSF